MLPLQTAELPVRAPVHSLDSPYSQHNRDPPVSTSSFCLLSTAAICCQGQLHLSCPPVHSCFVSFSLLYLHQLQNSFGGTVQREVNGSAWKTIWRKTLLMLTFVSFVILSYWATLQGGFWFASNPKNSGYGGDPLICCPPLPRPALAMHLGNKCCSNMAW